MNELSHESVRNFGLLGVSFLVFVIVLHILFEREEKESRKNLLRDLGLED